MTLSHAITPRGPTDLAHQSFALPPPATVVAGESVITPQAGPSTGYASLDNIGVKVDVDSDTERPGPSDGDVHTVPSAQPPEACDASVGGGKAGDAGGGGGVRAAGAGAGDAGVAESKATAGRLPPVHSASARPRRGRKPRATAPPPGMDRVSGYHVLVVDDERLIRSIAKRFLRVLGAKAMDVDDGTKVIPALDEHPNVEGIMLDIVMKMSNGVDVCRNLRAQGYTLPILAVTGSVGPMDIVRYKESGFTGLLKKPFTREQLHDTLKACREGKTHLFGDD